MHVPAQADGGVEAPASPLHTFNHQVAIAECWDVFDCGLREDGTPRIELQRIDEPAGAEPSFASDEDAWHHVVARAAAGSALHQEALRLVDPVERKVIGATCGWHPGFPG